jgi:hypothetical protein
MEYEDEVRGSDEAPDFPAGYRIRIPTTAPDKLRQAVDQLFIGDPVFEVDVPRGQMSAETHGDLVQKLTAGCYAWHNQGERESDVSPLNSAKHNAIGLGLAALTTILDRSKLPVPPERRRGERKAAWALRQAEYEQARKGAGGAVFASRSLHPLNVCFDRAHNPPRWVLISEYISGWDAARMYPAWGAKYGRAYLGAAGPEPGQSALVLARYWTPDWTGCWIDGQPALSRSSEGDDAPNEEGYDDDMPPYGDDGADEDGIAPNPYGFIPVWLAAGGHGHPDPAGNPMHELKGMIRDAQDMLIVEAVTFNQKIAYMRQVVWGPKEFLIGPDLPDSRIKADRIIADLKGGPEVVAFIPTGWQHGFVDPPPLPESVVAVAAETSEMIARSTIYDVVAGQGNPSGPAARMRMQLAQSEKKLADAALHIEQMLEAEMMARFAMVKRLLPGGVSLNTSGRGQPAEYIDLKPEDIRDGLVVRVRLTGESEEEKARKQQSLESRLGRTLDVGTYLRETGEKHPEEIIKGMLADQMRMGTVALLQQIQAGEGPALVAEAAAAAGIQFTPEELATAAMRVGLNEVIAATPQVGPDGKPVAPQGQVNGQGSSLPGTAYTPSESGVSDNPQVSRPGSPEALQQKLRLERRNPNGVVQ